MAIIPKNFKIKLIRLISSILNINILDDLDDLVGLDKTEIPKELGFDKGDARELFQISDSEISDLFDLSPKELKEYYGLTIGDLIHLYDIGIKDLAEWYNLELEELSNKEIKELFGIDVTQRYQDPLEQIYKIEDEPGELYFWKLREGSDPIEFKNELSLAFRKKYEGENPGGRAIHFAEDSIDKIRQIEPEQIESLIEPIQRTRKAQERRFKNLKKQTKDRMEEI